MARMTRHSYGFLAAAVGCGFLLAYGVTRPEPTTLALAGDSAAASSAPAAPANGSSPPAKASVVGPGRLEPQSGEVDLSVSASGVLASIPVKEGDHVVQGQILAELVNQDMASRVDQAAATLQAQNALLEKLKKGPRHEERQQAVAALQEQEASLSRLQRDLARQKMLFSNGYASNAQLEQAQAAAGVARAKQKSTAEALAQIDAGPRREDVVGAEAQVKLAKAQLDEARATLEKTRVRAPLDGVILRLYKHPGEAAGPGAGAAVLQIGDLDHLVIRTQIDEADIGRVTKGARAYVTAPAFPGTRFGGTVSSVSPRLGAKTIQTGAPTEKRDASVLDVLVTLDPGTHLPVGLRVDCYVLETEGRS